MKKSILYACIALACMSCTQKKETVLQTMIIDAQAFIKTQPDEASITINLSAADANIYRAKDKLLKRSNALQTLLEEAGIEKKDITTTNLNQQKDYDWKKGEYVFAGYTASVSNVITTHDLHKIEKIYSELLTQTDINVSDIQYSFSNPDSLQVIAYERALEKANRIADSLLLVMRKKHIEVLTISDVPIQQSTPIETTGYEFPQTIVSKSKSEDKIAINAGEVSVSKHLYVKYMFQ